MPKLVRTTTTSRGCSHQGGPEVGARAWVEAGDAPGAGVAALAAIYSSGKCPEVGVAVADGSTASPRRAALTPQVPGGRLKCPPAEVQAGRLRCPPPELRTEPGISVVSL